MATSGNWQGQWEGNWQGAQDQQDGSLSGNASFGLSTTGSLTAREKIKGSRRWYIIGNYRHYLTKRELAELLDELDQQEPVKVETPKGPKPVSAKQIRLIKSQIKKPEPLPPVAKAVQAKPLVYDEEDEELLLLFA